MGYKVDKLKREIYYKFNIDGEQDKFIKKISKIDILVNANKNKFHNKLEKQDATYILVKDTDDKCGGLLHTLQQRLGLKEIKSMEQGVLWTLNTDEKTAKEIADKLLYNENYQEIKLL
jgi:phosphoribosylformylglycinamidine (FGAM) synthase PurS component